jgi:hypothetical protein
MGVVAFVSGCSVLYDLGTSQCSTDADCAAWPGLICSQTTQLCEEPVYECVTNQDCLDAQNSFGAAAACIQNECQALQTAECPTVLPVIDDAYFDTLVADNPLILGAFANTRDNTYGAQVKNYDLAVTEFTRAGVGRPLVMVVCNNGITDDIELDNAMTHLGVTLKVPGIVAALESSHLERAVEGIGLENNIFFMSPLDSDSTLIRLEDRGLLWHLLAGGEAIAQSYAPLVERAINYVQPTEPVRIAQVFTPDIRFLQDTEETIRQTVTFNGMSIADNLLASNYLGVSVTSVYVDQAANYTQDIQQLRAFRPHIIIATATDEFVTTIGPAIEANWDADAPGQPRPFYILSPFLYNNVNTENFASTPDMRQRLIGLNAPAATDTTLYDDYIVTWPSTFDGEAAPLGRENFYDAAYYLLYSAVGAGQLLTSGNDLARGMGRLLSGPQTFGVGARDLPDAAAALINSSAGITLNGTLGPPNFDINGGRDDAGSVWCFNNIGLQRSDVMTYNKDTQQMDGSLDACFPGF